MAAEFPAPTVGPPQTIEPAAPEAPSSPAAPPEARASWLQRTGSTVRRLLHSKTFVIGAAILLFWVLDAMFYPFIAPRDPVAVDYLNVLKGPSTTHFFGTDDLGRDILSRVLAGARAVLIMAPAATALGLLGGITVGLLAGYYRGWVDAVVMRFVDAFLAFPVIIIAAFVVAILGPSVPIVILIIGIVFTPIIARTVRAAVLSEREREYVAAAKLLGVSGPKIMVREILPNVTGPIIVEATVRLGYAIFASATLAFLGFGVQPPTPDWGLMISSGRAFLQVAPWMVLFPAFALATLVVAINLVADGFRQVLEE